MLALLLTQLETEEDKKLFRQIYKTHYKLIYSIALKYLSSKDMAKDVFQEVFIAIVKNFDLLKSLSEEKIKAWICLVTKNKSLNINKKEAHSVPTDSGWFEERPGALGELANYIFLVDEINNLPEMYRNVLQWHYIWGFSEKDIAKQLNITPENVRQRVSRARKKLKERLEKK